MRPNPLHICRILPGLITLVSLLLMPGVHAQSYLLLHFPSVSPEDRPTFIAMLDRNLRAPHQPLPEEFQFHFPIKSNLALIPFEPGRYLLWHFDFSPTSQGDDRTLFLGRFIGRFNNDTIYYFGDIEFIDGGISYKPDAATILSACEKFREMSVYRVMLAFNSPKPMEIAEPCTQFSNSEAGAPK